MKESKPYRNALRSKRMIQNAYLTLLLDEEVTRIKAKDVIDLANISKGTFYAHYTSLQNVHQEIENEQLKLLFQIFENLSAESLLSDFSPLFLSGLRAMEQKRDLFHLLFRVSSGDIFLARVKQTFLDHMLSCTVLQCSGIPQEQRYLALTYVAGGALSVIHDWLEAGCNQPAEIIAQQLNEFTLCGVRNLFVSSNS